MTQNEGWKFIADFYNELSPEMKEKFRDEFYTILQDEINKEVINSLKFQDTK